MDLEKLNRYELIARLNMNETMIDAVPIGFCITDENGIFEKVNAHYCKIYGYSKEELIGEHFSIVTTSNNKKELTELHDEFIEKSGEINREWKVKKKNGEKITIAASAARVKGIDGSYKKVTYVIDITKEKNKKENCVK